MANKSEYQTLPENQKKYNFGCEEYNDSTRGACKREVSYVHSEILTPAGELDLIKDFDSHKPSLICTDCYNKLED